jgi:hypothetical protein
MAQTCGKCSRINPADAAYCYYDGNVLAGHARNGAPVAMGTQPFLNPFVFPSGRQCRNFDELAVACQEEWGAARDLLQQGYLESFLGGLGRSDLAMAAREAAHFPDRDRGLDQLLAKLPSHVLDVPKLRAEPLDVSLGTLQIGQNRAFQLRLENQGQRLLYGSVTVDDCVWLTLGDAAGAPEKLFQFSHETVIPVHVRGKQLRAGTRPLEGRLVVESNGGTVTVVVRVQVPVKPYPDGPLKGAVTPREVAQKAKAAVDKSRTGDKKEAAAVAALFQKGKVAEWYKSNGWTYPVQGPSASGLGAVQQFFEALGLTPPPKVEISERAVALKGQAGDPLRHTLEVSSPEKRPVYAHGVSDSPWLEVGRAKLNGRTATIPLVVPSVPDRPGQTLTARVTVTSNGKQTFIVPVTLTIGQGFNFAEITATPPSPVVAAAGPPAAAPATGGPPVATPPPVKPPARRTGRGIGIGHLIPAGLLVLALFGILVYDLLAPSPAPAVIESPGKPAAIASDPADTAYTDLVDTRPRLGIEFTKRARFGISMLDEKDPENPKKHKRLTYEENGESNNTCVNLEGQEHLFGQAPGKWVRNKQLLEAKNRKRWTSSMDYPEKVNVTQVVELVPGQSRLLDTVLVRYTIVNNSNLPRQVGLRVMLDTFIGANDGVPFRIPGRPTFLETKEDFDQKQIPDYVQAWERPDLKNPGTIAHLGLKGIELTGIQVEPIEMMRICRWPGNAEARWKWEPEAINEPPDKPKDSCVVLYWAERKMEMKERRDMAFTYGLSAISSAESGNTELGLTVGGSFRLGGEFTLTATVKNPQPGQKVTLRLPGGLALVSGQSPDQSLGGGGDYTQVSWRVRSTEVGQHRLEVTTGGVSEHLNVRITTKSIFD